MRWFSLLLLIGVGLAGCADNGGDDITPPGDIVDEDEFQLQGGKGAISGLLVDDRFRPIQLTDDPETEFQARGFILIQETGAKLQTTENGEFQVLDVDPGTYTLRFQVEDHEAPPAKVTVAAGEFTEENFIARRVLDSGATILTQEFTIWSDCWAELLIIVGNELNCYQDYSGDSLIGGFQTSYAAVADTLTYLVTETLVDRVGDYGITIGVSYEGDALIDDSYARFVIKDGDYGRAIIQPGVQDANLSASAPFDTSYPVLVTNFPRGQLRGPTEGLPLPLYGTGGVPLGAGLAVKTKVLQSAFLGEPDVDLEAYCVLCE